jgi:hypothetical protein
MVDHVLHPSSSIKGGTGRRWCIKHLLLPLVVAKAPIPSWASADGGGSWGRRFARDNKGDAVDFVDHGNLRLWCLLCDGLDGGVDGFDGCGREGGRRGRW